jgi:hypothetical protein
MKNIMCDRSARLNRLGPAHVPCEYPFPSFPLSYFPLFPLFLIFVCPSFHSLCKYAKRMDS